MISEKPANRFLLSFLLARAMTTLYSSYGKDKDILTRIAEDDAMDKTEQITRGLVVIEDFCQSLAKATGHCLKIDQIQGLHHLKDMSITDPNAPLHSIFSMTAIVPAQKQVIIIRNITGSPEIDRYFFMRSLIHCMLYLLHLQFKGKNIQKLKFYCPITKPIVRATIDKNSNMQHGLLETMPKDNTLVADEHENFRKIIERTATFMTVTFYIRSRHLLSYLEEYNKDKNSDITNLSKQLAEKYKIPLLDVDSLFSDSDKAEEVLKQALQLFKSNFAGVM